MNEQLKEKLKKLVSEKPVNFGQCLRSAGYEELRREVELATPLLDSGDYSMKTRVFWVLHDVTAFPKCSVCGKDILSDVRTLRTGYNKCKDWDDADFGRLHCSDEKCVIENSRAKSAATCLERYGVDNPWKDESVKRRIKETNMSRYGCESPGNSKAGRAKARAAWMEKYGVDHPLRSREIIEKTKKTCLERYGVDSFTKTRTYRERAAKSHLDKFRAIALSDPEIEITDPSELEAVSAYDRIWKTDVSAKCRVCGREFRKPLNVNNYYKYGTMSSCPVCHPSECSSKPELELHKFVKDVVGSDVDVVCNSRGVIPPYEIDVYVPSKNIAFEFDGLFWHSSKAGIDRGYHLMKTEMCEAAGIQLVHVFESEWANSRSIVESRIRNMLGSYDKTVYARKCSIRELDPSTAADFLRRNHIQGACGSNERFGLFDGGELVSVMTFCRSRFTSKYQWELARFCSKLGYHVVGGAGKLLKAFERKIGPASLVSYADRRWSVGKLYSALGFKFDHASPPDYGYWDYSRSGRKIESRMKYQKHRLAKLLPNFDPALSESENMENNGMFKIYDSGNLVFVKYYA